MWLTETLCFVLPLSFLPFGSAVPLLPARQPKEADKTFDAWRTGSGEKRVS